MPAAARILRLRSRVLFASWAGFSTTAAVETTTEQTIQMANATSRVFPMPSFLDTGEPPFDVGLDHEVIHQRCEQVGEENGQHDALGEGRVHDPDQHTHHANQD